MKAFTTLANPEVIEQTAMRTTSVYPILRRRCTYSIRTDNITGLSLVTEGLDGIMKSGGGTRYEGFATISLFYQNGMQFSEVRFNPSDGSDVLVLLYEYPGLVIAWHHWALPWRALWLAQENRRREALPYFGVQGLTDCVEALLEYLRSDHYSDVPLGTDEPVSLILPALRKRQHKTEVKTIV